MNQELRAGTVLVVGAGIMGAGIAQVAAQAGHAVRLFDLRAGAAAAARQELQRTLSGLVAKGKLAAEDSEQTLARIVAVDTLEAGADAALVVEAIVENLDAKRGLFRQLEGLVGERCILATNTSSISVTAIANGLKHPQRLVGMHFFNPVPLMKLVEVVSGLRTEAAVAANIFELAVAWGKVPVHARSTPGFIVNRIARPYYAETLALLLERAAPPQVIDACLKAAGFRMGPCELMDLIGHDTNFAVTQSVYDANFQDKRYAPSLVQRELVDGGLLGRKTGHGFYRYVDGAAVVPALPAVPAPAVADAETRISIVGAGPLADALFQAAQSRLDSGATRSAADGLVGVLAGDAMLALTDGRSATRLAADLGRRELAIIDRFAPARLNASQPLPLAYAMAEGASAEWRDRAPALLAALGFHPLPMQDAPGLVVARTLAMLVNEAADALNQGVCTRAGADAAMKLGVNYPQGPFEWLAAWDADEARGAAAIAALLDALDAQHRGERYRVSAWLRRRAETAHVA